MIGQRAAPRTIFVEQDDLIVRYESHEEACSGVQIYDGADKTTLFGAELEVYLEAAATGRPLGVGGLPSLVRLGAPGHYVFATFTLAEGVLRQSTHHSFGYKDGEPRY